MYPTFFLHIAANSASYKSEQALNFFLSYSAAQLGAACSGVQCGVLLQSAAIGSSQFQSLFDGSVLCARIMHPLREVRGRTTANR